jgi:hypothetical protein
MRVARYPAAAARIQRDHARQVAELALRAARGKLADAEAAHEAAQAAAAEHARRRSATLGTGTGTGTLDRAADLARSGAYAGRLQLQAKQLAQQLRAAQAILAEQARAVRLAELTFTRAYAEHEAIERHHERFLAAERKAVERAYELEAEERAQRLDSRLRTQ